jgi:hypothetical protein
MTLVEVLGECLRHFVHADESNAAMHCAPVRYSPITFRVAEQLSALGHELGRTPDPGLVWEVMGAKGEYAEDTGR